MLDGTRNPIILQLLNILEKSKSSNLDIKIRFWSLIDWDSYIQWKNVSFIIPPTTTSMNDDDDDDALLKLKLQTQPRNFNTNGRNDIQQFEKELVTIRTRRNNYNSSSSSLYNLNTNVAVSAQCKVRHTNSYKYETINNFGLGIGKHDSMYNQDPYDGYQTLAEYATSTVDVAISDDDDNDSNTTTTSSTTTSTSTTTNTMNVIEHFRSSILQALHIKNKKSHPSSSSSSSSSSNTDRDRVELLCNEQNNINNNNNNKIQPNIGIIHRRPKQHDPNENDDEDDERGTPYHLHTRLTNVNEFVQTLKVQRGYNVIKEQQEEEASSSAASAAGDGDGTTTTNTNTNTNTTNNGDGYGGGTIRMLDMDVLLLEDETTTASIYDVIEAMSNIDILISPHDPSISLSIFMPQDCSGIIEIFSTSNDNRNNDNINNDNDIESFDEEYLYHPHFFASLAAISNHAYISMVPPSTSTSTSTSSTSTKATTTTKQTTIEQRKHHFFHDDIRMTSNFWEGQDYVCPSISSLLAAFDQLQTRWKQCYCT